jgi:hypothetical protein
MPGEVRSNLSGEGAGQPLLHLIHHRLNGHSSLVLRDSRALSDLLYDLIHFAILCSSEGHASRPQIDGMRNACRSGATGIEPVCHGGAAASRHR